MVSPADITLRATTDQQAHAPGVPPATEAESWSYADAVSGWTTGTFLMIEVASTIGRSSTYLAAVGQAVLGDIIFDDDSADAIREGRERR